MTDLLIAPETTVPTPGIYPGVRASTYFGWDAASNSTLTHLLRSPAHLREALDNPKPSTDAQVLGTAAHTLVLEPERFDREYVRAPEGDGRTKAVKDAWAALVAEHPFATVAKPATYDAALCIAEAVRAHPAASALLDLPGHTEVSLVWDDQATGVRCKGRPDRLCAENATIVDLKTTERADREAFTKSIFDYGYHRQAAHYIDGAAALGIPVRHFDIIAVEKHPPYAVAVYRLTDEAIDAGRAQLRTLLATYRWCRETGEWPGYDTSIQDIGLPRWAYSTIESENL